MSYSSGETSTMTSPDSTSSTVTTGHASNNGSSSLLPSTIEKQFAIIEQSVYELGRALHELKQLCPNIQSTPRILSLAERVENYRTEIREDCRSMRTRLCIPFTIVETQFEDEHKEAMKPGIVEARIKDGPMFLCGEAALVHRDNVPQLEESVPFSLGVKYSCDSDYQNWRLPYKLVFTPDSSYMDATGKPFPSLSVAVDDSGMVQCAQRKAEWDEENETVTYLEEELVKCKKNPTPASNVKWRLRSMAGQAMQRIKGSKTHMSGPSPSAPSARSEESTALRSRVSSSADGSARLTPASTPVDGVPKKRGRGPDEDQSDVETVETPIPPKKRKVQVVAESFMS